MPIIGDYDEAIRAAKYRFKDPELRAAAPVMNRRPISGGSFEEPARASGSFAVAYKMKLQDGRMRAVRCYFAEDLDRSHHLERYRTLNAELPAKLKDYAVEFRYLDQGIRADSAPSAPYRPVVDMEWVQGRELRQYVAHIADHRDIPRLRALTDAWLTLIERMRAARIAHGDLSGNNIMVRDSGALALIDYDGMYTPALAKLVPGEAGAPDYQHPTAVEKRVYGPDMDRFSALLIYVALRALQERPELFKPHAEYNGAGDLVSDHLLFRVEDLKSPATSPVFRDLAALTDPVTLKLVETLKRACVEDITRTPWVVELADPLIALKTAIASDEDPAIVAAADVPATRANPDARAYDKRVTAARNNLNALVELRNALRDGDDERAVGVWARMTETSTTRPLKSLVDAAQGRANLTRQLRTAIRDDDFEAIKRIEVTLKGTATLKPYEKAIHEAWVRAARLDVIRRALDSGNDELALRVWDLAIRDPKGVKALEPYTARIEQVRARASAARVAEAGDGRAPPGLGGLAGEA